MHAASFRSLVSVSLLVAAVALTFGACGSRTGLLSDLEPEAQDATFRPDVTFPDAAPDQGIDAPPPRDAGLDAPKDAAPDVGKKPFCNPGTCASLGYQCGKNGDGCGDVIDCGPCPPGDVCGAKQYSQCAAGPPCKPKTCAELGFNCGPAGDGCGGLLQCGICQYPDVCGGGGTPGRCGNTLPCTNLCPKQVACDAGTTSITGTVVAGTLPQYGKPDPVYNALVYVPNAPVSAFKPGVECSQCGADVSGEPLVATQTAADGTFTLSNMPVGDDIPLVIQLGRWRRQVIIPHVEACTSTPLPQELTRMPRNKSEGDIPLIAIATGNADATECVLMKMGVDQAEFTLPSGGGRVQMYLANGANLGPSTPPAAQLWDDPQALDDYDLVLLPCEGREIAKPANEIQNFIDYSNVGGRIFTTHYGYTWLDTLPPFTQTAVFDENQAAYRFLNGVVDTSTVKGQAFATWLATVGALTGPNQLTIDEARHDLDAINPPSVRFMYAASNGGFPLEYAFQTPVTAPQSQQCGRVFFSDFHVASGILTNGKQFPSECTSGAMTAQEKALEFMLFDLASCIPRPPQNCRPQTCAQQNITCGPAGDGCGQQIDCGSCNPPETCGGGDNHFQCGISDAGACVPKTCQELGFGCGLNGDGCGNVIDCGACVAPQTCGGGGKPNTCGP